MSEKNYQFMGLSKTKEGHVFGAVEGWTFMKKADTTDGKPNKPLLNKRVVNVNGTEKTVVDMTISGSFSAKQIEYFFGKEAVPENDGSLFIKVSLWDRLAENILKYNPSLQQVIEFIGVFKVDEYNGHKSVSMNAFAWKPRTAKKADLSFSGNADEPAPATGVEEDITPVDDSEIPF